MLRALVCPLEFLVFRFLVFVVVSVTNGRLRAGVCDLAPLKPRFKNVLVFLFMCLLGHAHTLRFVVVMASISALGIFVLIRRWDDA